MENTSTPIFESRRWPAALAVAAFGALLLAGLARSMMHHAPLYDELLHVLAARGLIEQGAPVIDHGVYPRAKLFTRAVAVATQWYGGNELVAARLPSLLAALALIALVGAWTTRKAGALAGVLAATLLAASLQTIQQAVFARFYTVHALALFVAFICGYELTGAAQRRALNTVAYCVVALAGLALAWHLQSITVIAVGALALGLAAGATYERRDVVLPFARRHAWWLTLLVVGGAIAALLVLPHTPLYKEFTQTSGWAEGSANRQNFYNQALGWDLPLFWPLLPFALVAVALRQPRMAWTFGVAFVAALIVTSLASQKAARYLYYAYPLLAILMGVGLSVALIALRQLLSGRCPRHGRSASALVLGALLLSVIASQEGIRSVRLLLAKDPPSAVLDYGNESDWTRAKPVLMPAVEAGETVIVSNAMKALFYLGRYDYELNASIVYETDTGKEFGLDERTGRHAIGKLESLEKVLRESPRALVVVENKKLGMRMGVRADVIAYLERSCTPLAAPEPAQLKAWSCRRTG